MNTRKGCRILATLICLYLMLTVITSNVIASPQQQTKTNFTAIDAYITEQMNNLGIPGIALGIVQGDQIVHLQGFGVADSSGRVVTPQTPFYIASVTKTFTALAVMQLVEAGKIDLDEPVQKYLPWFELADKEASAMITVRNLLNHTTGISGKDNDRNLLSRQGLEETVRGYKTIQLTQPIGTTFQYSGLNYSIAGLIVEMVSGQSYADYVTQHIFKPLDMRHSHASRASALADGLSEGHYYMFGYAFRVEKFMPPAGLPSGGLIVSVEDLTHYAIAQLNEGRYGDTPILSPLGITELHAPSISAGGRGGFEYSGLGWAIGKLDGMPIIGFGGVLPDFRSEIYLLPQEGWGVVLLANANGFEQFNQVDDIAKSVVGMLNGKSPAPVSLPFLSRFLYWSVLLTPLLMILGIAYSWRYWRNKGIGHIILTVVLYGTVALLWFFGVPVLIGSPIWPSIWFIYPELAYGLIAAAILGIGWSIIYMAMNLRRQKSN